MMRISAIDVGSNGMRMVIGEVDESRNVHVVENIRLPVRLGQDVFSKGYLEEKTIQQTEEAFLHFRHVADGFNVARMRAVATSAAREAANNDLLVDRIFRATGIEIEIISGEDEARLIHAGVAHVLDLKDKRTLLIDIGGGSTELIYGNESGFSRAVSLNLGSVRLTEKFLRSDPVHPDEVARMNTVINEELDRLSNQGLSADPTLALVGIAGTFTTLAAMEKSLARYSHSEVHGSTLTIDAVIRQRERLERRSIAERRQIAGLEPQRADVIFAGACLVERIMARYHARRVIVSDHGVRYGLLHEAARALQKC